MFRKLLERRVIWKIYGFLFLISLIYAFFPLEEYMLKHGKINSAVEIVIEMITVTAIFLFAFRKKWLSKQFWKAWAIFYILWGIYEFKNLPQYIKDALAPHPSLQPYWLFALIMYIVIILLQLPVFICLYLYAFKENRELGDG